MYVVDMPACRNDKSHLIETVCEIGMTRIKRELSELSRPPSKYTVIGNENGNRHNPNQSSSGSRLTHSSIFTTRSIKTDTEDTLSRTPPHSMGSMSLVLWCCMMGGFGFTLTHTACRSPRQGRWASKAQWIDEEMNDTNPKRSLHPMVDVLKKGFLVRNPTRCFCPCIRGAQAVGDGHELYYEVRGKYTDLPMALWLHGGPGAGCYPNHARFCDPTLWRVTLVDQRGCGRST